MTAAGAPGWRGGYWEGVQRERSERERARQARRAERSEAGARLALRLGEPTHNDQFASAAGELVEGKPVCGQLGIKVTEYPDGLRVVAYRSARGPSFTRQPDIETAEPLEKPSEPIGALGGASLAGSGAAALEVGSTAGPVRSESSLARSRALVVHRARCLGPYTMWTFTKRGKFASLDDAWSAWAKFIRYMKKRFGSFPFVAVPELHSDGETWHIHCLVHRFYMVEQLSIYWQRALGGTGRESGSETLGNVDVAKTLKSRGGRVNARRAACYIAKYIGKGFAGRCSYRRMFGASRYLDPVRVARGRVTWDAGLLEGFDIVRRWVCQSHRVEWFPARFIQSDVWGCAIAEVAFPLNRKNPRLQEQ